MSPIYLLCLLYQRTSSLNYTKAIVQGINYGIFWKKHSPYLSSLRVYTLPIYLYIDWMYTFLHISIDLDICTIYLFHLCRWLFIYLSRKIPIYLNKFYATRLPIYLCSYLSLRCNAYLSIYLYRYNGYLPLCTFFYMACIFWTPFSNAIHKTSF